MGIRDGHDRCSQLSGLFQFFSGTVSLLGRRGLPGEAEEFGAGLLQPLRVGLQGLRLLRSTETPVVRATFLGVPTTLSSSRRQPRPGAPSRGSSARCAGSGRGEAGTPWRVRPGVCVSSGPAGGTTWPGAAAALVEMGLRDRVIPAGRRGWLWPCGCKREGSQ